MDTQNTSKSPDKLRIAAEQGDPEAQWNLAVCYDDGRGVLQDLAQAIHWFRQAAEQGHSDALIDLGVCYEIGRGVLKDEAQAYKLFRRAADQNHLEGFYHLAQCYEDGIGVPCDPAEAAKWYLKAAEAGHTDAQVTLSVAYKYGRGVAKDQEESIRWLRGAAENGLPRAQLLLGWEFEPKGRLEPNPAEAIQWIRRAAVAGYPGAQAIYGSRLLTGDGIEQNRAEGFQWYRKAAAQGEAAAEFALGICYTNACGTDKNIDEARKWLRLAAQQDFPGAKFYLRHLFFQKYSIPKWRNITVTVLGWAFLILYGIRYPISINYRAVAAFLGVFVAIGVISLAIIAVTKILGIKVFDEADADFTGEQMISELRKRPWQLLLIPAEDGFFLLPLLYAGVDPVSAVVAAFLFGLAHYLFFPGLVCIPKGVAYFFVALFILPYGIWSVVLGHLIVDAVLLTGGLVANIEGKPTLQRISKVLGTR